MLTFREFVGIVSFNDTKKYLNNKIKYSQKKNGFCCPKKKYEWRKNIDIKYAKAIALKFILSVLLGNIDGVKCKMSWKEVFVLKILLNAPFWTNSGSAPANRGGYRKEKWA